MHDGIVVVLVELPRGSDLLYKTTFCNKRENKQRFHYNSVKYGVLKSWLQHHGIREKFDLSIINYRQIKACCMPEPVAGTSRYRIFLIVVVICPPARKYNSRPHS
jgi:hypothetical protein